MTSFEVLVSNHQLVAGDRVSTRAFKDAPGIFPLRVLYYASPPDLCTDVTMPNCRHKKAAKLSGADDRFEVLVRSVCDSSGGFVKSCRPYLAVSRAIRAFPQIWGKLSAKYSPLTASCRLATVNLLRRFWERHPVSCLLNTITRLNRCISAPKGASGIACGAY